MSSDPLYSGETGKNENPHNPLPVTHERKPAPSEDRPVRRPAPQGAKKPAPAGERPVRRPAPQGERKPAPSGERPVSRPAPQGARKPASAGERPVRRPAPQGERKPAPAGERPVRRPASQGERKPASAGERPVRRPAPQGERKPAPSGERRPPARRPAEHPVPRRQTPAAGKNTSGYSPRFASEQKKNTVGLNLDGKNLAIIALLVLGSLIMIILSVKLVTGPSDPVPYPEIPEIPPLETAPPVIPTLVSEARITVTGDLLPHKTIYSKGSVIYQDEQNYNFDPVFKFLGGYTDTADYAVANLETSLFGPEKAYSGNPKFNTPDQIVDGAKNAGFDMLLTANNHCNDTGLPGVLRTVQVIRDKGLKALGTNLDSSEQKYHIQDLNGIRVGMLCYTYEDSQNPEQVTFNYNPLPADSSDLVCAFPKFQNVKSREPFYEKVSAQIQEMRQKGADIIVMFLHWGDEYYLQPNADQRDMAQRLCDLGVDVIVGGHPHVVEPVELLTNREDPQKKTVCLYSLGNAFSNQRREEMTSQKTGHTEDGMLFNITLQKYSDHSVYLSSVEVIPTWVDKHPGPDGKREYNILPLDSKKQEQWQTLFGINDAAYQNAAESYERTMKIVGTGVEASNALLSQQLPGQETPAATTSVPAA